jgi:hypothetical protein
MTAGHVYILLNSTMPGLLKIGMTSRTPEERARELSQVTGVPVPYSVAYSEEVIDCEAAERLIHSRLADYQVNRDREFFHLPLRDAIRELMQIAHEIGVQNRTVGIVPADTKTPSPESKPEKVESGLLSLDGQEGWCPHCKKTVAYDRKSLDMALAIAKASLLDLVTFGFGGPYYLSVAKVNWICRECGYNAGLSPPPQSNDL